MIGSEHINTRDGWRPVGHDDMPQDVLEYVVHMTPYGPRYWVRAVPLPPLPTEDYTVIRVAWSSAIQRLSRPLTLTLMPGGKWYEVGVSQPVGAEQLLQQITSFAVLAEPRAETARAVAARIEQGRTWDEIRREFGVEP